MKSYKTHFRRALEMAPDRLHFAAHSHHLWPDVSFEAHVRCWEDAARLADSKWEYVFGTMLPRLRARIAEVLELPDPTTLVFAPSTHELVMRVISCIDRRGPVRILTTGGEFHSFRRQWMRLVEAEQATVEVVDVEPFDTFAARFAAAADRDLYDLVYVSRVMFDSGHVVTDLDALADRLPPATEMIIDGYHHFMAVPGGIGGIAARAFYVSGGYKYAMSGEGICFMHCPPGRCPRPVNTGWFAGFGHLTETPGREVAYGSDASRFMGATFDPAGAYRMLAVLDLWGSLGVGVHEIHERVRALEERFLDGLARRSLGDVSVDALVPGRDAPDRGHFLTFRTPRAGAIHERLRAAGIVTDFRGNRLRFGFGVYHDPPDVDELLARASGALAGGIGA